ncbi:MAG TPA: FHA domain-containing protein [Polyangiaceae bacterium]
MSPFVLRFKDLRFPLRLGETLVGRSPYCSIVLTDPLISRQHVTFLVNGTGVSIRDLGSRNGTRVNGQRLRGTIELRLGDTVEVGNQRFEVESYRSLEEITLPLTTTGEQAVSVSLRPILSEMAASL